MPMLDAHFRRQNKTRDRNGRISSVNFDYVTYFDVGGRTDSCIMHNA